jgi:hypothetical protein
MEVEDDELSPGQTREQPQCWPSTPEPGDASIDARQYGTHYFPHVQIVGGEMAPAILPELFMPSAPIPADCVHAAWPSHMDFAQLEQQVECHFHGLQGSRMPAQTLTSGDEPSHPPFGSSALPTRGSMGHQLGTCRPCGFFHKQGCSPGVNCEFCHLCDQHEKKRRLKEKKAHFKAMRKELR